ncbi:MAG: hypothetical protein ACRENB_16705 [Gemmatimonadales bacterium]
MQEFASRDLMVAVLPETEAAEWLMDNSCQENNCTNDTRGGCCPSTEHQPKPKPKGLAFDSDLDELLAQLRAARS